mgnify:CR=1 FL=1
MDLLSNIENYYEFLKMYFVGSSIILVLLFFGYMSISHHLTKLEQKINFLLGDDLEKFDKLSKVEK